MNWRDLASLAERIIRSRIFEDLPFARQVLRRLEAGEISLDEAQRCIGWPKALERFAEHLVLRLEFITTLYRLASTSDKADAARCSCMPGPTGRAWPGVEERDRLAPDSEEQTAWAFWNAKRGRDYARMAEILLSDLLRACETVGIPICALLSPRE